MNLDEADQDFLRDLVKTARQRTLHIKWVDRDGSARLTTLTAADAERLTACARKLGISKDGLLQQAAHLPALHRAKPASAAAPRLPPPDQPA